MEGTKFTWFPKLTSTAAKVPEECRGAFLWALAQYGTYGVEPDLKWPLDAIFESLREDIDSSKRAIAHGSMGGRGNKSTVETTENHPFKQPETTLKSSLSETEKGGFEDAEVITRQDITLQEKTGNSGKARKRFVKPTAEQVSEFAASIGHPSFSAAHFIDYYESNGWKVGRNPMKDWKATVRNWCRKESPRLEGGGRYAAYDV